MHAPWVLKELSICHAQLESTVGTEGKESGGTQLDEGVVNRDLGQYCRGAPSRILEGDKVIRKSMDNLTKRMLKRINLQGVSKS